jgi:hypothetical protein
MIGKWYDRKSVKANFLRWKKSDDPFLLLHVPDTQEIRAVRRWMKEVATPLRFAAMQVPSDCPIVKSIFLKELTEELDNREDFPSFYKEFGREVVGYLSVAMRQGVGNGAQAGEGLTASEIVQSQNNNIVINQMPTLGELREDNIEKLFDLFLHDFKQSLGSQQVMFSFQFLKAGFQGFSDNARQWLRRLCRNLSRTGQVKICIVNQGELEELLDFDTDYVEKISNYLFYDDILKETEDEWFCSKVVDPNTKCVSYVDFIRDFAFYQKRGHTSG